MTGDRWEEAAVYIKKKLDEAYDEGYNVGYEKALTDLKEQVGRRMEKQIIFGGKTDD